MKNIFNLAAVFVNAYAAAVKAASTVFRDEGGVVIGVMKDIREGFEQSDLPKAIEGYKTVEELADADLPTWMAEADAEVELFGKTFLPYFKEKKASKKARKSSEEQDTKTN